MVDIEINAWSPGFPGFELKIDWTNVSFGLMFIKTHVQNDYSP